MGKGDRDDANLEAVQLYTHLATHSESRGGEINYTRAEAIFVLRLTAALVARGTGN